MAEETAPQSETQPKPAAHPIAAAIDRFVHRARDTKLAARQHLPLASSVVGARFEKIKSDVERLVPMLKSGDRPTAVVAQKELTLVLQRFERFRNSDVPGAIEVGLYLSLFAAFDAFVGDLLRAIYTRKPQLFGSINRQLSFSDVLAAPSLDALKEQVLDEDIEALRRKSYPDQFAQLATRFDIKLTGFDRWPDFVERSQRRNLLTHCDGIVSEQYLNTCREHGVASEKLPSEGTQLGLGPDYFFDACELVLEVGVKLGQTLWRKTLPEELSDADEHLMMLAYDTLTSRIWARGRMLGAFAMSQRQYSSEWKRRAMLVNYVQALKRSGAPEEAMRILQSVDWSAAGHEFCLADLVLRDKYDEAATLMRRVGSSDSTLTANAYHTWPLFLEFRETDFFAAAYRDVFGHAYVSKLEQDAAKAAEGAAAEAKKQEDASAEVDAALARDVPPLLEAAAPESEPNSTLSSGEA
ncbi:MAG: hypothetical protein AB1762_09390 [Gemmatimonadota bacterium]